MGNRLAMISSANPYPRICLVSGTLDSFVLTNKISGFGDLHIGLAPPVVNPRSNAFLLTIPTYEESNLYLMTRSQY